MHTNDVIGYSPKTNVFKKNFTRIENILLDLYYQRKLTGGHEASKYAHLGAHRHGTSSYSLLRTLFKNIKISPDDVLVDVGCGKGRVINCWLNMGLKNRMVGIELDDSMAQRTKNNLKRFKNVEIISGNILTNLPGDGTIFYLFNPFEEEIMIKFIKLLQETFINKSITIVYNNCLYLGSFKQNENFLIEKVFETSHFGDSHPIAMIKFNHC